MPKSEWGNLPPWHQDDKYRTSHNARLALWLDTARMLTKLAEEGRPLSDQQGSVDIIKTLADEEAAKIRPRNW